MIDQDYKSDASYNYTDNYEQKDIINGSVTLSMDDVTQSMDYFKVGRPTCDEISETH